ncbi:MAG: extensin family protein [Xanthobacteraceae bacterium]|nr:extensin family protein [Xanthobacteraceae bacterium]
MTRRIILSLMGCAALASLAGCGGGFFQLEQRAPWRAEAEAACLKSGTVKETAEVVRINPISGPGVCGAEYPLKVAALGEGSTTSLGFADDMRPPAAVGGGNQPRWPGSQPGYAPPPQQPVAARGPVSLNAPGVAEAADEIALPAEGRAAPPGWQTGPQPYSQRAVVAAPASRDYSPAATARETPLPALGPARAPQVGAFGAVTLKPTATLACPIVSALDQWLNENIQPAAIRWFGARVVEIKQISAYSCRGMNGNPRAHISEHAFGNALDVAGFTLADGRYISVQKGWKGLPEEQGFLRDVQGAACQHFTTVLAPGANVYHYNHIHVDLMRRSSGRVICKPAAVSGEMIAARAGRGGNFAYQEPAYTSSIGRRGARHAAPAHDEDDDD